MEKIGFISIIYYSLDSFKTIHISPLRGLGLGRYTVSILTAKQFRPYGTDF